LLFLVVFIGFGGGMMTSSSSVGVPQTVVVAPVVLRTIAIVQGVPVVQKTGVAIQEVASAVLGILDSRFGSALACILVETVGVVGLWADLLPPPLRALLRVHTLMEARITSTSSMLLMLLLGFVHRHVSMLKKS